MARSTRAHAFCLAGLAAAVTLPAHADVSIAEKPTRNVSCTAGSCVATAHNAVLNIADLESLLASQATVSLDAGLAKNITVDAAVSWTSNAMLSLSAAGALTVNKPVSVTGSGGVTIRTKDGALSFAPKASISFWNLSSTLTINETVYTLVSDFKPMGSVISTPVALARDYDASVDGTYSDSPIAFIKSAGHLEGLGHAISHLSMVGNNFGTAGFVGQSSGALTNLHIEGELLGGLKVALGVGSNTGLIQHVSARGTILGNGGTEEAGLVVENSGTIRDSSVDVNIRVGGQYFTGGLVAINSGTISTSWADGIVRGTNSNLQLLGGLVSLNLGAIQNSYSLANTKMPQGYIWNLAHGGLIGQTSTTADHPSSVVAAFSAGTTAPRRVPPLRDNDLNGLGAYGGAGGLVGSDGTSSTFQSTYWATDSNPHNPKTAAGNKVQLAGASGLTEAELKAALPAGFDPKIWAINPAINGGYPYLRNNPPQ